MEVPVNSRNPDGRFRNHNQPLALTEHTLRARWLEGEVLRMKRLGFSYEVIAQQITEVGRGLKAPLGPLPENLSFPPDYKITAMGCHKALSRALKRAPRHEADELRQVDTDRCEEMYLRLSPGIRYSGITRDPLVAAFAVFGSCFFAYASIMALHSGISIFSVISMRPMQARSPSESPVAIAISGKSFFRDRNSGCKSGMLDDCSRARSIAARIRISIAVISPLETTTYWCAFNVPRRSIG